MEMEMKIVIMKVRGNMDERESDYFGFSSIPGMVLLRVSLHA